jgi:hypothetical protein
VASFARSSLPVLSLSEMFNETAFSEKSICAS